MHGAQKLVIVFSKVVKVASPITVCRQSFGEMIFFFFASIGRYTSGLPKGMQKKAGINLPGGRVHKPGGKDQVESMHVQNIE